GRPGELVGAELAFGLGQRQPGVDQPLALGCPPSQHVGPGLAGRRLKVRREFVQEAWRRSVFDWFGLIGHGRFRISVDARLRAMKEVGKWNSMRYECNKVALNGGATWKATEPGLTSRASTPAAA